jgi:hypothetical protein
VDYSSEWAAEQGKRWEAREHELSTAAPEEWRSPIPRFDVVRGRPAYEQIMGLLAPFSWVPPWQVAGEVLLWRHLFRVHNAPLLDEVALTGPPVSPADGLHLALLDLPLYAFRDALPLVANPTSRSVLDFDAIEIDAGNGRATAFRLFAGWLQPCWKLLNAAREEGFCRGVSEALPVMRFLHRCVGIDPETVAVSPLTALAYNNKVKGIMFAEALPEYFRKETLHDIATYANRAYVEGSGEWKALIDHVVKRERIARCDADGVVFEQFGLQTDKQIVAAAAGMPVDSFAAVDLTSNDSIPDYRDGAIIRGTASSKRAERRRRKREREACIPSEKTDKSRTRGDLAADASDPSATVHAILNVRDARDRIRECRAALEQRGDTVAVARLEWLTGRALGERPTLREVAAKYGLTVPQLKAKAVVARVDSALFAHRVGA